MTSTVNYCDRNLKRILVELREEIIVSAGQAEVFAKFNAFEQGTYLVVLTFVFNGMSAFMKPNELTENLHSLANQICRWMILNGTFKQYPSRGGAAGGQIYVRENPTGDADFHFNLKNGKAILNRPSVELLPIEESKLARRAIITLLYLRGMIPDVSILKQVDLPENTVLAELQGLVNSTYLSQEGGSCFLTTAGREWYEHNFAFNAGTVFIIAACAPPKDIADSNIAASHQRLLSMYKSTVSESGLAPIFQEHEEPRKNIYVDIFDYINTCECVIADITWERPNCYVEIGYALAREKPVLLFVEESYLLRMEKQQMPFDLGATKYQTYTRTKEGLAQLDEQLRTRIDVIKGRKMAD